MRPEETGGRSRIIFVLILTASFLDSIDYLIVQVALPTIRSQFAVSLADSQWVIGAYGITLAGFLLLSGRLGDAYGQKRVFVWGMALFTLSSLGSGLAPSLLGLVSFRLLQGIGAAMTTVTALAIFIGLFRNEADRVKYYGIFIASFAAGGSVGVVSGGALTDAFGWRSVFFVNVPIGVAIVALSLIYLRNQENVPQNKRLDLPGAFAATIGLIIFVYALTIAANAGLASPQSAIPLVLSFVVLLGFLVIESRARHPLLPFGFLWRGSTLLVNTICFLVTCTAGVILLLTVYFQTVLGWSAFYAGVGVLPLTAIFLIGSGGLAARVRKRVGIRRTLIGSMSLQVIGAAVLTQISNTINPLVVFPGMIVFSLGASLVYPAIFAEAGAVAVPGEEGLASGVINTSFRVGFPAGLAMILAVVGVAEPSTPGGASASIVAASLTTGLRFGFVAVLVFEPLALLVSLGVRDNIPAKQSGNLQTG